MIKLEPLAAGLIAAAIFATPAMARTSHMGSSHRLESANARVRPPVRQLDGRSGILKPHFAGIPPAPPDGENCDVGDNPFIC
jgi:hypothetical protein